jgi:spore germination cell wall hydrolase CwlJ-like protein
MMLETAILCLALTVLHESRGEPIEGQVAVAQVILNRAGGDVNNVCAVVNAPGQFKGLNLKKKFTYDISSTKQLVSDVIEGNYPDYAKGAVFFKHIHAKPWKYKFVTRIGKHNFYKK